MSNWMKKLEALAPYNRGVRLEDKLHKQILVAGDNFKQGDNSTEGAELYMKIKQIHNEFNEKNPFRDMFGEYMESNMLNEGIGQFFTPYNVCDMITEVSLPEIPAEIQTILDPAAGTGRFMLSTAKHYAKKLGYFNFTFTNIDIDYRVWVFCIFNALLNNIPGIHILGDSLATKFRDAYATMPSFLPNGDEVIYTTIWRRADAKALEEKMKKMMPISGQQKMGGGNAVVVKPSRRAVKGVIEATNLNAFFGVASKREPDSSR